jgi:hypothetical protein
MKRSHRRLLPALLVGALTVATTLLISGTAGAGGQVYPSPEAVKPLQPGARVPSVKVEPVRGEPVDLAERVREQGALLVFYRGGW